MKRKKGLSVSGKCLMLTAIIVVVIAGALVFWGYRAAYSTFDSSESVTVIIPDDATDVQVGDSLKCRLGDYGTTVYRLWSLRGGNPLKAAGVYNIVTGDKAWSVASRILSGRSSTVKVTFNNVRLMDDLANRVAKAFPWSAGDFLAACDSLLPKHGFGINQFQAAFLPDTYEFYASAKPDEVVLRLLDYRNLFWTDERREKARKEGLTPIEVAVLASIVEEESNNRDERPVIARLYMNRLKQGMKLQADPTVRYALQDFTIRRITNPTGVDSPYNTYLNFGLPPGPIRVPEKSTLDAVLNSSPNNYLYMCAKPDMSGTHNFTDSYSRHMQNARLYHDWLDSRGITAGSVK